MREGPQVSCISETERAAEGVRSAAQLRARGEGRNRGTKPRDEAEGRSRGTKSRDERVTERPQVSCISETERAAEGVRSAAQLRADEARDEAEGALKYDR